MAAADYLAIHTVNARVGIRHGRPSSVTGAMPSSIPTLILGRSIVYGGDDPSGFEQTMATIMPRWTAYEMRLMAERYVSDGMIPEDGDRERLTAMLGRPLHSYRKTAVALTA